MSRSKYRILGQVGQGQFAQVFCGIHRETGNLVALKSLQEKRFPTHRFLRELHLLARLQHPNIVKFHTLSYDAAGRYLVTDYCEGGTLRDLMESPRQLKLDLCLKLIIDILQGLDHAHECGVIHSDLKPENILLVTELSGWTAQIGDFGVAQLTENIGGRHVSLGATGSPAYMAPERYYKRNSPASDLYAVGIILFELVVGHRPFSGRPGEMMVAHLNKPVVIPEGVPLPLHSIITKALQKLPQRRFSSAKEMLKSVSLAAEILKTTQASDRICSSEVPVIPVSQPQLIAQNCWPTPITHLAVDGLQIRIGVAQSIHSHAYTKSRLTVAPNQAWPIQDNEVIEQMHICSQGCFVLTRSLNTPMPRYSLHHWSSSIATSPSTNGHLHAVQPSLNRADSIIKSWHAQNITTAIDPLGHWLAVAMQQDTATHVTDASNNTGYRSTQFQILRLPGLVPIHPPVLWEWPEQLLALDHRHGLAILPNVCNQEDTTGYRTWRLFNRRGGFADYCRLPATTGPIALSTASPYQLLTLDASDPTLALLVTLKPLKVMRIALDFIPTFIIASQVGYVLASKSGQMLRLDHHGEILDQCKLFDPSEQHLTAIAALDNDELLIATCSGQGSRLYTCALQQLMVAA